MSTHKTTEKSHCATTHTDPRPTNICCSSTQGSSNVSSIYIGIYMHSYTSIKQGNDNLLKFNFPGFYEYLTSIAGGKKSPSSATTIVTDIQNYFLYTNPNSNTALPYYDLLLDMNHLKNYLQHLQNNFQFAATD